LISFIMDFKRLQFLNMGAIGGIYGYIAFVRCITFDQGRAKLGFYINECAVHGELDDFFYMLEVKSFHLNMSIMWMLILTIIDRRFFLADNPSLAILPDNSLLHKKRFA
jgi:hypothetical protein